MEAQSAVEGAKAGVMQAQSAAEAAQAGMEKIREDIRDATLISPINGRVLYRLVEPGEVLGAGGNILTLLDITDVYMTLFLPTSQAGAVSIGSEARIVLDVRPDISIPAKVTFVSPEAQFTPKSVETRTEREKLMFRIKIKIPQDLLQTYAKRVKTGLPGVAYIQLDPNVPWPVTLPPLVNAQNAR
jgi:HlyD family secretion protein